LFEDLTKLSENIKKLKQLYRSSRERFVTSNVRKKEFAIDNASDEKIEVDNASDEEVEAGNASDEEVVASDKRNRKRRTTNNLDLRE
jgi:hypothetical protein